MDYTGLGRFTDYKINRPLTEEERNGQLNPKQPASDDPLDWLSVIKINSTYLELVDRWYAIKGFSVWMGMMLFFPFLVGLLGFAWVAVTSNELGGWVLAAVAIPLCAFFVCFGLYGIRLDAFRQTHYPIRLNRKTRQVYAYRPDGTIIQASWDALFFCEMQNKLTLGQASYDIRAHVLDENGETVKDTFTLGYVDLGERGTLIQLWEYVRRYMEEPDGVKKNYQLTELCPPIDGRREGLAFGIVRTFAPTANRVIPQLLISPMEALNILGRWFAMSTSKVPRWPEEVEAACQVDPDDPYCKDWRDNGKYDFWELGWPLICFAVGLVVIGTGITWLVRSAF